MHSLPCHAQSSQPTNKKDEKFGTKTIDRKAISRRLLVEKTIGQKRLLVENRQLVEIFLKKIPGLAVPNSGKFRVWHLF